VKDLSDEKLNDWGLKRSRPGLERALNETTEFVADGHWLWPEVGRAPKMDSVEDDVVFTLLAAAAAIAYRAATGARISSTAIPSIIREALDAAIAFEEQEFY
jgi:hypothetical protein